MAVCWDTAPCSLVVDIKMDVWGIGSEGVGWFHQPRVKDG
jgi:hypothetical protein